MIPSDEELHVALTTEQLWQPVPGGSGTYIRALAAELAAASGVQVTGVTARHASSGSAGPLPVDLASSRLPRALLYESWSRLRRPQAPRTAAMRRSGRRYDVVHATTWAVPPRNAPLVVTVHDVAFLRNPEHFTPRGVQFFRRSLNIVRHDADVVVVPSETTRSDCTDAGIDPGRIHVIPHGTEQHALDAAGSAAFARSHGLERDFVLWCGTLEPRKNLPALLDAFRLLLADGSDLDLVLVGPQGWGETSEDVRRAVDALPPDRLHVLGRLSTDDLQHAYAAARVFCFPSLWEGFGMPVLEAMVHGTPVVTSQGTSMEEISDGAALLVDPHDPAQIAAALVRAAGEQHDALSAAGRAVASASTWRRSAEAHVEAYRAAISSAHQRGAQR
ncbi:glycosyltransferase family 4 protein [Sanguibacter antarcticus]|uniref:Glycosyltransferase involved in cell wall biosynthesis n=1 Tax=Sanguibacter antarcticus TaxID=372484 RepID=A0A2A9E2T5_9MICO|nr:glycosyltransferase family 1 protein [Sanguibacter antarcticus]PFG32522.1 glycosyltransferase involved in cell wall biosynthesis [Sanguibacter antarcticus]